MTKWQNRMGSDSALRDEREVKINPFPVSSQVVTFSFPFYFFFSVLKLISDAIVPPRRTSTTCSTNGNWRAAEFTTTHEPSGALITNSPTLVLCLCCWVDTVWQHNKVLLKKILNLHQVCLLNQSLHLNDELYNQMFAETLDFACIWPEAVLESDL